MDRLIVLNKKILNEQLHNFLCTLTTEDIRTIGIAEFKRVDIGVYGLEDLDTDVYVITSVKYDDLSTLKSRFNEDVSSVSINDLDFKMVSRTAYSRFGKSFDKNRQTHINILELAKNMEYFIDTYSGIDGAYVENHTMYYGVTGTSCGMLRGDMTITSNKTNILIQMNKPLKFFNIYKTKFDMSFVTKDTNVSHN